MSSAVSLAARRHAKIRLVVSCLGPREPPALQPLDSRTPFDIFPHVKNGTGTPCDQTPCRPSD